MTEKGVLKYVALPREWFAAVNPISLRADMLAALTGAAIALPQGVAFAVIAGLPPEYGLYTAMLTPIIAAMWGASMVMVSGPATAISAVLFASLSQLAPPGTPLYIQLALTMTIVAGLAQLLAGVCRLGGLIAFISHSVMVGFTAAAALLIGASQLGDAFGLAVEGGGGVIERLDRVIAQSSQANPLALVIALTTLLTLILMRWISPRLPSYLIALIVGSILGELTGAADYGVEMFQKLPAIVPAFAVPDVTISQILQVLPGAVSVAFVGLLEAIGIGRSFAMRRQERYDSNQEIIGQGLSNFLAGFVQGHAGSGSFTRSALNVESGAQTPMAAILAAPLLFVLLFLLAPYVDHIPKPAMAGIIIYVAWRLFSFAEIRHILTSSRSETLIFTLTFLSGVATQLENAIFVGVVTSLAVFLHRSARPHVAAISPIVYRGRRLLRGVEYHDLDQCPQISVLRLEGALFFGSIEHVEAAFRRSEAMYPGRNFRILALKGMGKIDLAGVDLLVSEYLRARKARGDLHIVIAYKETLVALRRMKLFAVVDKANIHPNKAEAIAAVMDRVDPNICATCRIRAFVECAGKPAPPGINSDSKPPVVDALGTRGMRFRE
ncbi:SulP family inorganic anion transporter [Paracoccus seriniphilus]|uniref:Sulfate permease, SulP family n=1 Tax=Paracoccus seriniphilus TaxID=184748 RepID=A0A239Q170_9RHOB|nr:SulP family inorganic anion transporter [Paracoccus seriniphilus]WCR16145.1 SulP family inorganic anion transporter [Paracoccus seriniphilus]SNT76235.1 sulfate permease, SulP family [Paracoccus seriniphilus]